VVTFWDRAIHQLLFGEGGETSGSDLDGTFDRTGGGERPAGSALALVLDRGDGTLCTPVNAGWGGSRECVHSVVVLVSVNLSANVKGFEFFVAQAGEFIDSHEVAGFTTGILGVVFVDEGNIVFVDGTAVFSLGVRSEGLAEGGHPVLEGWLDFNSLGD
jgi:hypothetical protein